MTHLPSSDYPCARCGVFCRQLCLTESLKVRAAREIREALWTSFGSHLFTDNYELDRIFAIRDLVTGIVRKYHLPEGGWVLMSRNLNSPIIQGPDDFLISAKWIKKNANGLS